MTTLSATEARRQLYKLVDEVQRSHEPIQITAKRVNAVLVGEADWRGARDPLPAFGPRDAGIDRRGAQMTECRIRLRESRVSTSTGRQLSPGISANHTSPRRAAGPPGQGSLRGPVQRVVVHVVGVVQVESHRQADQSELSRAWRRIGQATTS
jgi:prevent-host-death family protein